MMRRGTSLAEQMLDDFFSPSPKQFRSFRECYVAITGDKRFSGRVNECDAARMREAVDTLTWQEVLGNSIARRLQQIYAGMTDLQAWRKVVKVGNVNDFRTQNIVGLGGYGKLPVVAEGGVYAPLISPPEGKSSYAATKRGGLESVTLEMIKNDDVRAIRRIPEELALAAANTLYEFVFGLFEASPVIYDGEALFSINHNNLFNAPLSAVSWADHSAAMARQPRAGSARPIGVRPELLLVPIELEETAYNMFVRAQNQDKTFNQVNKPEIVRVDSWLDATDFVTIADPVKYPVMEVGFLDGKEDPELFSSDVPDGGSMFSNDKLTFKIRHIYGGAIVPYGEKGVTKAVVAG